MYSSRNHTMSHNENEDENEKNRSNRYYKPWTKLVETKFENPVNSRNDSIFQIPKSPSYPLISMLILTKFCCQKSKTLAKALI